MLTLRSERGQDWIRRFAALVVAIAATASVLFASAGAASAEPAPPDHATTDSVATDPPPSDVTPMIVGGRDASEHYAFMVSVQDKSGKHWCGGTLVERDWVMTAAHCESKLIPGATQVRVGSYHHGDGGELANVTTVVLHPGWKWEPGNDVALIKLDRKVRYRPIEIAKSPGDIGALRRAVGWGTTCDLPGSCRPLGLQEADARLVSDDDCVWYDKSVELCTRGENGSSVCFGDSGGPLVKKTHGRWEQIGVVSRDGDYNESCSGGLAVFTDVTKYVPWIKKTTSARTYK